jgi:TolB-like protein/tetratricopeptide (TPR) repeat protein
LKKNKVLTMNLFQELRRRRVFRTAALYIVAAWIVLQVSDLGFPALNIPEQAIRFVWLAAILGFPVAMLFGWRYQVTENGIVRTLPAAAGETADMRLRKADYILLGALAVVAIAIAYRAVEDIRDVEPVYAVSAFGNEILPNSIAFLPLDNLTGDSGQDYFVDGIHEAITSVLSQISGLRVKSRRSTSRYGTSGKSVADIGRELGVANILDGSVFRTGESIRVMLQLIDAATDENIWAQSYEREIKDIVALQSEIARTVAKQINVELTSDEITRLSEKREVNPEVYQSYLKGMYFLKALDPMTMEKGFQHLHEAIEKGPRDPLAYAGLALGYNIVGHGVDTHGAFPSAAAAARKALELDDQSGEAWAALAEAQLYYDYDWASAEKSFLRAMQLSPNFDDTFAHYAYLLTLLDRVDEGLEMSLKARQLSPVEPLWAGFTAWMYMAEGRYDEAMSHVEECLAFEPGYWLCLYTLGQIHTLNGEFDEAIAVHEQMLVEPEFANWALGITYAMAGKRDSALATIEAMEAVGGPKDAFHIALAYAALGDVDEALDWMDKTFEMRTDWLPWIVRPYAYGGALQNLRGHERFEALLDELGVVRPE